MFNAAKPPVWRAWLLLALTCWACIAPGVALALPTANAPGFAKRGLETRVGVFCGNYGPARPVASSQVAELHQAKPAYGYETASGVHVYLYANVNPLSGIDPSGRETSLVGLIVASYSIGILAAMAVPSVYALVSDSVDLSDMPECLLEATLNHYGADVIIEGLGGAGILSGGQILSKGRLAGAMGATEKTSIASRMLRSLFSKYNIDSIASSRTPLGWKIWSKAGWRATGSLGGFIGRWLPLIGSVVVVWDGITIGVETVALMENKRISRRK